MTATDSAAVESFSTLTETANVSNTAAGLAAYLDQLVPLDYDYTTASGARTLATGNHVRVGPTYGGAGIKGAVYVFNGAPGAVDLGAENYLDTVRWTRVDTSVNPSAFYPNLGNLTKSSAHAIGILIVLNDVRSSATATVTKVALSAASAAGRRDRERADQGRGHQRHHRVRRLVLRLGHGPRGQRPDGHQPRRHAHHGDAQRQHGDGDRGRHRRHGRQRGRHRRDAATTLNSGDQAVSVSLAFNTLGYRPSNALFNLIDAILGDPLISTAFKGEDPALALATVTGTTLSATGAVRSRDQPRRAQRHRQQRRDSAAAALFIAKGTAVGAIVASNKVSSGARATLDGGAVTQAGRGRGHGERRGEHPRQHQGRRLLG